MAVVTPEARAADTKAIKAALKAARGNIPQAAVALGMTRRTLDRRIAALDLRAWVQSLRAGH